MSTHASTYFSCCHSIGKHNQECADVRAVLADAAQHASDAAVRVCDAQVAAHFKLDEDEVKGVVAILLAAEGAVKRLAEAVAR